MNTTIEIYTKYYFSKRMISEECALSVENEGTESNGDKN